MSTDLAITLAIGASLLALALRRALRALDQRPVARQCPHAGDRSGHPGGAKAYLNRQYTTIAIVGVVLTIVLALALVAPRQAASSSAPCSRAPPASSA